MKAKLVNEEAKGPIGKFVKSIKYEKNKPNYPLVYAQDYVIAAFDWRDMSDDAIKELKDRLQQIDVYVYEIDNNDNDMILLILSLESLNKKQIKQLSNDIR